MPIKYYLLFTIIILNLGPLIRFKGSDFFHFFFFICLIDPLFIIAIKIMLSFHILLKAQYYACIVALIYSITFPLFDIKLKLIIIILFSFSISLPPEHHIVLISISSTIYFAIIIFLINDQISKVKNSGTIEVFIIFLSLSVLINIIRGYFLAEDFATYYNYTNLLLIIDLLTTILITAAGPRTLLFVTKKKAITNEKLNYDLTNRELQVLKLISKGLTSQEIADKLYLSKKTIDYYRCNIKSKLNITKKSELINFYTTNLENISQSYEK